jgi:hypothetical protein
MTLQLCFCQAAAVIHNLATAECKLRRLGVCINGASLQSTRLNQYGSAPQSEKQMDSQNP